MTVLVDAVDTQIDEFNVTSAEDAATKADAAVAESSGAAQPAPKTQKSVNTQPVVAPEKTTAPASDQQVPPADDGAAPRRTIERAGLDRRLSALQDLRACLSA